MLAEREVGASRDTSGLCNSQQVCPSPTTTTTTTTTATATVEGNAVVFQTFSSQLA